jgi:hypothetical protein
MGDVDNLINSGVDGVYPESFEIKRRPGNFQPQIETRAYSPRQTAQILKSISKEMYLFESRSGDFVMHISTHAEPSSGHYNCGGLRIVPQSMVGRDYRNEIAALRLGAEMDAKGDYARVAQIAGPLVIKNFEKIQFGKHVACPPIGARVGEPREMEFMEFIVASLSAFRSQMGIDVITGQDLGHGRLASIEDTSLGYLSSRFSGCMEIDTSLPTAFGNFCVAKGLMQGLGVDLKDARVGLVGFGNIGRKLGALFNKAGVRSLAVCEANPSQQDLALRECDGGVWAGDEKRAFLEQPFDIVIFNSNGGSLDKQTVDVICNSKTIKAIAGCENMIWPQGQCYESTLMNAGIIMPPTEFTGMGGWLAAAEASLAKKIGVEFELEQMFEPLKKLIKVSEDVIRESKKSGFNQSFAEVLYKLYS